MDYYVFKDDRVFDASAVSNLNLSADGHVWSDLCTSMDLSRGVDTDDSFDLVRVDVPWLCQNHRLHRLVVIHVVFLCLEQFINVIDPEPEVFILVQVVQIRLLFLAQR